MVAHFRLHFYNAIMPEMCPHNLKVPPSPNSFEQQALSIFHLHRHNVFIIYIVYNSHGIC